MRVAVVRHVPFEHLGRIEPALASRGIQIDYAEEGREEAAGLIFMGGPMSANDDLPFIREEQALIERAARAGTPLLGICLGAQLIAKALGAKVYRNPVKEIGWYPVVWNEAAGSDALQAGPRRSFIGTARRSTSRRAPPGWPARRPAATRPTGWEAISTDFSFTWK